MIRGYAAFEAGLVLKPFEYKARELGAHDVEVEIHYSGICHSDLHAINGEWGPVVEPVIPGHEIVGVVAAVGSDVKKFKVGDSAAVGPQVLSCGACGECRKTSTQFCTEKAKVFLYNFSLRYPAGELAHGGYARGIRAHEQFVHRLPEGLPMEAAAPLLCAGATVFRPLRENKVGPGSRVGVIGIGGLGHLAIQFAAKMGAAEVVAISSSQRKAAEASALGATKYLNSSDAAAMAAAAGSLDLILMTASFALDWNAYFNLLAPNGSFVFLGAPGGASVQIPVMSFIMKGIRVSGSLIGSADETQATLDFAAKHGVLPWVHVTALDNVNAAVQLAYKNELPEGKYRIVLSVKEGSEQLSKM